eukprot:symbB.v1.2.004898.t1/scaffold277.1/size415908/17
MLWLRPHDRTLGNSSLTGAVAAQSSARLRQFYTLEQKLGAGAFGTVWRATCKSTGLQYAVKMVPKNKNPDSIRFLEREVSIMQALDHPNVLKLLDVFEDERFFYLVPRCVTYF